MAGGLADGRSPGATLLLVIPSMILVYPNRAISFICDCGFVWILEGRLEQNLCFQGVLKQCIGQKLRFGYTKSMTGCASIFSMASCKRSKWLALPGSRASGLSSGAAAALRSAAAFGGAAFGGICLHGGALEP